MNLIRGLQIFLGQIERIFGMNNDNIKVMAYYLPQYHEMEINNKWWGKGFTEWVNVKKAESLFEGHQQPKVPLNKNYYDLNDVNIMRWQADIARNNGLYGFCFYHYWFDNEPTMETPLLNFLNNRDIEINYCICWANESWTNTWAGKNLSVIKEQKYGNKDDWKIHFEFLLNFFKDPRYILEENKPLLVVYRPYLCDCMIQMINYWNELAKEHGFDGIKVASQRFEEPENFNELYNLLDYHIEYQPRCYAKSKKSIKAHVHDFVLNKFNIDIKLNRKTNGPHIQDYDELWNEIISLNASDHKAVAGGFVNEDTTPRHGRRGKVTVGVTPEKFEKYMKRHIKHVKESYTPQYIFLFAWNEWGEGAILEPEETYGYSYLEALKNAVNDSN